MWDLLFDWSGLMKIGADAAAYMVIAVLGTVLFLLRLGLAMFGGADSDFDTELDYDADFSFQFFSVLSILAFFMGSGWMGLACRLEWGLGRVPSSLISAGFGLVMMMGASALAYATRRLNREITYDVGTAVGHTARVYLTIPEKGSGHGQIEVSVSGRKKVLKAVSAGPEIAAFSDVKVLEVRDDETLVVEPLS